MLQQVIQMVVVVVMVVLMMVTVDCSGYDDRSL
jgi:hypothetical protein